MTDNYENSESFCGLGGLFVFVNRGCPPPPHLNDCDTLQRFSLTAASAAAGIGNELANCSSPAVRQRLLDAARRELLPAELPHDCKLEVIITLMY
jgi:hypothetical protein